MLRASLVLLPLILAPAPTAVAATPTRAMFTEWMKLSKTQDELQQLHGAMAESMRSAAMLSKDRSIADAVDAALKREFSFSSFTRAFTNDFLKSSGATHLAADLKWLKGSKAAALSEAATRLAESALEAGMPGARPPETGSVSALSPKRKQLLSKLAVLVKNKVILFDIDRAIRRSETHYAEWKRTLDPKAAPSFAGTEQNLVQQKQELQGARQTVEKSVEITPELAAPAFAGFSDGELASYARYLSSPHRSSLYRNFDITLQKTFFKFNAALGEKITRLPPPTRK